VIKLHLENFDHNLPNAFLEVQVRKNSPDTQKVYMATQMFYKKKYKNAGCNLQPGTFVQLMVQRRTFQIQRTKHLSRILLKTEAPQISNKKRGGPAMMSRKVVLPAPEAPMTAKVCPLCSSTLIGSRTVRCPSVTREGLFS
jgi:hypothetical protein